MPRPDSLGWTAHPDKRRFSITRTEDPPALHASRAGVEVAYVLIDGHSDIARSEIAAIVAALPSVYPVEPPPPILSLIERARDLARKVARLDEIESESAELRAWIEGALS